MKNLKTGEESVTHHLKKNGEESVTHDLKKNGEESETQHHPKLENLKKLENIVKPVT